MPNIVLMNIMACRVFRDVELIAYRQKQEKSSSGWMTNGDMDTSATLPRFRSLFNTSSITPIRSQINGEV